MYNQWALQQVAAMQFAALQQQQQQTQLRQQFMGPNMNANSPVGTIHNVAEEDSESDEEDEQKRTLFCANLDERVTEELLYEVFLQAGPVESVRIPKDNVGRQRTFGFVTYMHSCTSPYAMQLYQGLSLFRKPLTIKFQGNTSAPATPQQQRRSQPSDCEPYQKRRSGGNSRESGGSYDNNSLRSSNFAAFNDGSPPENPFKREARTGVPERISKHASGQSRPHQNAAPYQRRSGGSERDNHGNDYQRRHQHSGNNRRSEQRNNNGRR